MDTLSSSEFRKVYATLRAPTRVTVNGHPIGTWTPSLVPAEFTDALGKMLGLPANQRVEFDERPIVRPFVPVPKPSPKGR